VADFVTIEKGHGPEGRIAVVRFDRGDGINALSPEALRQLTDAARSFEDDAGTSVVVLTGGKDAFLTSRIPRAARVGTWISAPCAGISSSHRG
jgi:enoyl-CoA hydratase/carnithine racemase